MRTHCLLPLLCGITLSVPLAAQSANAGVVISQVYGGGGNQGASLRNDFIELFNRTGQPINITGWSVQYASASGVSWDRTLLNGIMQPGQYFLVQEVEGNGGTNSLPTPDISGGINLSATSGKIALVSDNLVSTGGIPTGSRLVDFVGYGDANAAESGAVSQLTNTTAASRKGSGCTDTNNNRADFNVGAPVPRNSRSPVNPCVPITAPAPVIDTTRVALNSATFSRGQAVAPGSLVSIFGANFATGNTSAESIPLASSLAKVSVTINGVPAPISGVFQDPANGDQINAQVPWSVPSSGTVQLVVTQNGSASTPQPVSMAAFSPGIFALQLSGGKVVGLGSGQAIAYGNNDGQIAAPPGSITGLITHPARINDPATLVILANGLGGVDTSVRDGDVPSILSAQTLTKPAVTIGGVPAQVVFSGLVGRDGTGKAYGFVGVYQINVVIAPGTPVGSAVPVVISMNGVSSQSDVTIAVQQ